MLRKNGTMRLNEPRVADPFTMWLLVACIVLTVPAFMLNLGVMPYNSDEPTRAIVTMEMIHSGNYITPTLTGEYYYNKPPLYNWILVPFLAPSGGATEWCLRLPMLISLYGLALSVFLFTRRWFGSYRGVLAALLFMTCGRVLFWDSLLGLIDMLYSWVTFLGFVVVINGVVEKQWRKMFLLSYFLAAAGFMLKGMPTVVFQGFTLITVLLATRNFRKFWSPWHGAGIALFVLVTGAYLLAYSRENSLQQYIEILWDQSSQRTAVRKGFVDSLQHLVLFHPSMIYHFLPWSLGALLLFSESNRRKVSGWFRITGSQPENHESNRQHLVLRLVVLVFCANVLVYWFSPATIPRYVLMLAPLTFIPALMLVQKPKHLYIIIPSVVIFLLVLRIAVNLFYVPVRAERIAEQRQKQDAIRIAERVGDNPLHIVGKSWIDHVTIIYIMTERGTPLKQDFGIYSTERMYLADERRFEAMKRLGKYEVLPVDTTFIRHGNETVYLFGIEKKEDTDGQPRM